MKNINEEGLRKGLSILFLFHQSDPLPHKGNTDALTPTYVHLVGIKQHRYKYQEQRTFLPFSFTHSFFVPTHT